MLFGDKNYAVYLNLAGKGVSEFEYFNVWEITLIELAVFLPA